MASSLRGPTFIVSEHETGWKRSLWYGCRRADASVPPGAMRASNRTYSPPVSRAVSWKMSRSPVTGFSTVWPATIISASSAWVFVSDPSSMRPRSPVRIRGAPNRDPCLWERPLTRERGGELPPGVDRELAVDARQVDLDGLHRHEERLRDLLVALVLGGKLGHAALARRQ